jgi:hypothetical protein
MIELFSFLIPIGLGALLGGYLARRPLRNPKRAVLTLLLVVIGIPVVLFVFANLFNDEVLGWIAGLSLMVVAILAPLVALGFWLGRLLVTKSRPVAEPSPRASNPGPASQPQANTAAAPRISAARSTAGDDFVSRAIRHRWALLAAAGIPAAFWVMIAVGFWIQNGTIPVELRTGFPLAVIVLIGAITVSVRYVWVNRAAFVPSFPSIDFSLFPSKEMAQHRAWLASLAADPRRRRYADLIAAGEWFWTPEAVEYDLDLQATACCQHLVPIESEMRSEGLRLRLSGERNVDAGCRIDASALSAQFALPDHVAYQEMEIHDRSYEYLAHIRCESCGSNIWVVHPKVASADTPLFPRVHAGT